MRILVDEILVMVPVAAALDVCNLLICVLATLEGPKDLTLCLDR